jgi:hypothetical protein
MWGVANKLLKKKMSINDIVEVTGLTHEEVEMECFSD